MNQLINFFKKLLVFSLTFFLLLQLASCTGENEHEEEDEENEVIIVDGYKAINLDEEAIVAAGIVTEYVERMFLSQESIAYAEVIDIASIVALKGEYETALSEKNILVKDLNIHNRIFKRAEALHQAKSLSTRELDKSRAERDLKSSQLSAINTRLSNIRYKIKSIWGNSLTSYLLEDEKKSDFELLASNQLKLVLLSLPKNKTFTNSKQNVFVSHINDRSTAKKANYLDQAVRVNNPLYGESYYYLIESKKIRTGMKLFAWVDDNNDEIEGLFIPESAVVWYANQPWIYLKQGEELFIRKPLTNSIKINKGWLLEDEHLISDELVVTQGGQTLLSEEFKWAIPDEDDD